MVRSTRGGSHRVRLGLLDSGSWLLHWCWFRFERHLAQDELLFRLVFVVGHGLEDGMLVEVHGLDVVLVVVLVIELVVSRVIHMEDRLKMVVLDL